MKSLIITACLLSLLVGCATPYRPACDENSNSSANFINANYAAVDRLIDSMPLDSSLGRSQPLLVASFVGIDELASSRFGKTVAEQMASRLTNKGYRVIELKLRNNIFMQQKDGEFMLSRELKDISKTHNAQAALVGIYSESMRSVFVTAKIVSLNSGIAVAATDYQLCMDTNIRFLLAKAPVRQ